MMTQLFRAAARAMALSLALAISACGGGSGTPASTSALLAAPSALSYPASEVFTVGQAITGITPIVTGTVTAYTVNPQLPAGVTLDTTTGAIAGTPTAVTAQANYTFSASNSSGSATTQVSITVNDTKPHPDYMIGHLALVTGVAVSGIKPVNDGGTGTAWSIAPDLPAGLSFNTTDGSITGASSADFAATVFTVTASNAGGTASTTITLSSEAGTILELGHADSINSLHFDGTHVLSEDITGHWVLWDYATATAIASGDSGCTRNSCYADSDASCISFACLSQRSNLAASTVALATVAGFEIRSASDGHVVATIAASPQPSWWRLAADGSYLCAGSTAGLTVWSQTGQMLFSRAGNYASAKAFAASTEIRIVGGPAGTNIVETIAVATAAATVSPSFQGTFAGWFIDGERFLSAVGTTTLLTYSKVAVQQDATSVGTVGTVGGTGNWFWNNANVSLSVYSVGSSTTAAATHSTSTDDTVVTSGSTIGVIPYVSNHVGVFDLSGSAPVFTDHTLPVSQMSGYAAASASNWISSNEFGVLFDGASLTATPRFLGYGQAWSIAGSDSRFAVATASGRVMYFDSTSNVLQGTIGKLSSKLQLSQDGSVLAAMGDNLDGPPGLDGTLGIYSLPSQTLTYSWPYNFTLPYPTDITLSGSGTMLGQILVAQGGGLIRQVSPVNGGAPIWTDAIVPPISGTPYPIRLSPNGSLIAIADGPKNTTQVGTQIISNGVLVNAVQGWPAGWLDDNRLVVNTYAQQALLGPVLFAGAFIYDATGKQTGPFLYPGELTDFQPVTAQTFYIPNSIQSIDGISNVWLTTVASRGVGAVAGPHVVFASGARVYALSR